MSVSRENVDKRIDELGIDRKKLYEYCSSEKFTSVFGIFDKEYVLDWIADYIEAFGPNKRDVIMLKKIIDDDYIEMIALIHSFYPLLFENIDIDILASDDTSFFEYSVYCLSLRICKYCLEYFAQNTKLDSLHTKSIIRALMISQYSDDPEYHTMIQLLLDYNLYNPFETYYFENDDDEFYIEHIHLIHSYYTSKKSCQESITALLGLKKCNSKVLGGNGKDVLTLLGKYIRDSRYEEKWGQKGHVIKRKFI